MEAKSGVGVSGVGKQSGFTLVELAIVMTIIGLLIGGILKGQELMQNARMTATVAQVKAFRAALTTFRDEYQGYPGDLPGANNRIRGCTSCESSDGGDGYVGKPNFDHQYVISTVETTYQGAVQAQDEPYVFWQELMLAKLIGGVTDAGQVKVNTQYKWGVTHPAAKINGGFLVGELSGQRSLPGAPATQLPSSGLYIFLLNLPTDNMLTDAATSGKMPLSPARAAQIDGKMDDGKPDSGDVLGWGFSSSCYNGGLAGPYSYKESITASDCGLVFGING